ncbi:glycosyl hydrolase family 18 protein [uncultured Alistipes sp.]|uniref:glycosyl hydrolase family 18 protein n=1 Tax=uncultured Alistipes sp. TaxID=538949 RepID=UPI002598BF72|nr:glycosyl hydrolase family 18 protein [uncultured Alistipes sp.]
MKRNLFFAATMLLAAAVSCQKAEPLAETDAANAALTRAYNMTPKITIYVETNDVNPLNAGDYLLSDGTPYASIVELFASNIHAETVGGIVRPTLYLNDKMTNLLENGGTEKYIKPLQDKGIKVLLTVLGDWAGIGLANMNDTQAEQFAKILAYAVEKYGLDGIGFDDEYANYSTALVRGSFGNIITKLRGLMPADKLITVFQYGNCGSSQIDAAAGALINYAYTNFSYWNTYIGIAGVTKDRYAPEAINLGDYLSTSVINRYGNNAYDAAEQGYGAIMHFNLRTKSDRDPLKLFNAIADGAYGETVTCENGNRPQDWTFVPGGFTISIDDVQ